MTISDVALVSMRRRNKAEFIALMECRGTGGEQPSSFAGREVVESLTSPRVYQYFMQPGDLKPEMVSQHRGSIRYVLERMTAGTSGSFVADAQGQFRDFHGGSGFRHIEDTDWFTDAALRRGIAWYTTQTYRVSGRDVARYRIIRMMSKTSGLGISKERI